jgi:hypothetical protein
MKKILIILLISIFALTTGCNDSTPRRNNRTSGSDNLLPTNFTSNIPALNSQSPLPDNFEHVSSLFIIYPASNSDKYRGLSIWQTIIQEKYGIELFVHYPSYPADILAEAAEFNGVIYLHNTGKYSTAESDIYTYGSPESAYDLSQYYIKYGWAEYFDSEFLEKLRIDGGIYVVPTYTQRFAHPRYYNSEYLNSLGMEVPKTVFEFYDFLKGVKALKKGNDNYYPMCIWEQRLARCTSDIFRAYGAYVNSVSDSAVSFDPNTGAVEDAVFSPDFEKALDFIKGLQTENLLFVAGQDMFDGTFTTKFDGSNGPRGDFALATEYREILIPASGGFISDMFQKVAYENQKGYYLTGSNTKNVCEVTYAPSFYVFPKGIENINGVIELFDMIFTNTSYYADLRYGIQDTDYIIANNTIIPEAPLFGSFVDLKLLTPVEDYYSSLRPEGTKALEEISSNLLYEMNIFNDFTAHYNQFTEHDYFGYSYPGYFGSLFNKDYSAVDAIEQYKNEFYKSGKVAILQGINDRLGMVMSYDYSGN